MIYKISFNYREYQNVDIDPEELLFSVGEKLGFEKYSSYKWDGMALKKYWEDIGGSFLVVEGDKLPDITLWDSSCLLMNEAVYQSLKEALTPLGEFLPITIDNSAYYIFNCLNYVLADKTKSKADIQNNAWLGLESIGFEDGIESKNLIFRSKFSRGGALYCGDAFKIW